MPKIKFINEKKEVEVEDGANLRLVALENGIELHHHGLGKPSKVAAWVNCSAVADLVRKRYGVNSKAACYLGGGICGTCHVFVKKGAENCSEKGILERGRLAVSPASIGHEQEMRLACKTRVHGDVEVETHPQSNLYGDKFW